MTTITPTKKLNCFIKISVYTLSATLMILFAFPFFYLSKPQVITADTWIDEDGGAAIHISDNLLSIYSMNSFYYFDKVYSSAIENLKIRLCIGPDDGAGIAQDCFENVRVTPASYSKKNHALIFDIARHQNAFTAFKQSLRDGNAMKVSVDDDILYASYSLHSEHALDTQYEDVLIWVD